MRSVEQVAIAVLTAAIVMATMWLVFGGNHAVAGEASADPDAPPPLTELEQAVEECRAGEIRDDGTTLILDMFGEVLYGEVDYSTGSVGFDDITCALGALEAPASVTTRMGATRALDGMQDAEWDGFSASWTYHPDDGLDVIVTLAD